MTGDADRERSEHDLGEMSTLTGADSNLRSVGRPDHGLAVGDVVEHNQVAWIWFWPESDRANAELQPRIVEVPVPPAALDEVPGVDSAAMPTAVEDAAHATTREAAEDPANEASSGMTDEPAAGTGPDAAGSPAGGSKSTPSRQRQARRPRRPGTDAAMNKTLRQRARRRCKPLGDEQRVTVKFTIGANGRVLMAVPRRPHADSPLGHCVTRVVDAPRAPASTTRMPIEGMPQARRRTIASGNARLESFMAARRSIRVYLRKDGVVQIAPLPSREVPRLPVARYAERRWPMPRCT